MPSQFDQFILPNTPYIQEYQGIPLAEMEASGQRLEEAYMSNLASSNKMDILNAERQSVQGDSELNRQVASEYAKTIDEMAKDGDYEHMHTRLSSLARNYARDPRIKAIQESRKNFDQEQLLAQKISAEGGTPLFLGDAASHQSYDSETGQTNIYRPRVESMLDYASRRKDIASTLNPDQFLAGDLSESNKQALGDIMDHYFVTGTVKSIGNKKIEGQFANAIAQYESTPEYKQELKLLESQGVPNAKAVLGEKMGSAMNLRSFYQYTPRFLGMPQPAAGEETEGPRYDPSYALPATPNKHLGLKENFDSSGKLVQNSFNVLNNKTKENLSPAEAVKILQETGSKEIEEDPVTQLGREMQSYETTDAYLKRTGEDWKYGKYNIKWDGAPEKDAAKENLELTPFLESIGEDPERYGLTANATPEQMKQAAANLYNLTRDTMGQLTTEYWGGNNEEIKGQAQVNNYMSSIGMHSGQNIALITPDGKTYENNRGFDGILEDAKKDIKDRGGNVDNITVTMVDVGTSKGNTMGIPGAKTLALTIKDKTGTPYQYSILQETSKEEAAAMAPLQKAFEEVATGIPGERDKVKTPFGDYILKVYAGPDGNATGTVFLGPNLMKAFNTEKKFIGLQDFQSKWNNITKPYRNAYK